MSDSDGFVSFAAFLIVVAVVLVVFWILFSIQEYQCSSKWSRYPNSYHMIQGCMINPDGRGMIPAENFRVL